MSTRILPTAIRRRGGCYLRLSSSFEALTLRLARSIAQTLTSDPDPSSSLEHLLPDLDESTTAAAASAIPVALSRLSNPSLALSFLSWARLRRPHLLDSAAYSQTLLLLARSRRLRDLDSLLDSMREDAIDPSPAALSATIATYTAVGKVHKALEVYENARSGGVSFERDAYGCNRLLAAFAGRGELRRARKVFDEMCERGEADNWSTFFVVSGLCGEGRVGDARALMDQRFGSGCVPNSTFYNALIGGHFRRGDFVRASSTFREMKEKGFLPTVVTYGVMINGFCKNGDFVAVGRLVAEMRTRGLEPNAEIYNNLIDVFIKKGSIFSAKAVLRWMIGGGCSPDVVTYNTFISGYCRQGDVRRGERLLLQMLQNDGLVPNALSYTPIVRRHCRGGDVLKARGFLLEMLERGISLDLVAYGVVIHGLVTLGEVEEALDLKEKMVEEGVLPDAGIFNVLINGLCKKGLLQPAKMLLREMFDRDVQLDEFVYATLIDGCVRNGYLREARKVFEFIEERKIKVGVVVYNAIIKGLCSHGFIGDAWFCVGKMRRNALSPDGFTYNTLIDGYVKLNDLDGAFGILAVVLKQGIKATVVTYSALINGLCREGEFNKAERILAAMQCTGLPPNVVTYSTLIGYLGKASKLKKAIGYFEEMLQNNCRPNVVTYGCLISSLTNCVLKKELDLHEGNSLIILETFRNMILDGWGATIAAYNAIVSCLCKYGMVKAALDLRGRMVQKGLPVNAVIFISLLHGLHLTGRLREWETILTCNFDWCELQNAQKYCSILDRHIHQGQFSEASRIFQMLLDRCKSEATGQNNQESLAL